MTARQPMETAPTDGTRVLVLTHTFGWSNRKQAYEKTGTRWAECWFVGERWHEWCGNNRTHSTSRIDPIAWAPLPE